MGVSVSDGVGVIGLCTIVNASVKVPRAGLRNCAEMPVSDTVYFIKPRREPSELDPIHLAKYPASVSSGLILYRPAPKIPAMTMTVPLPAV